MLKRIVLILFLFIGYNVQAQSEYVVSGNVRDSANGEAIPFATATLKSSLIGTVTSETGNFELHIPDSVRNDILLITLLGYTAREYALNSISGPLKVQLAPARINLNEIPVTPQPPTYYIKLAMNSLKQNYPAEPFESSAYYREIVKENSNFLRAQEGVFKTYYPNLQDSSKNQHQLMLFRRAGEISELMFMKKERMKKEAKAERKEAKAKAKGKETTKKKSDDGDSLKIGDVFGGPENLLRLGDFFRDPDSYLDSNEFKNYKYEFAPAASYNNTTLMVIRFKSRGKVDQKRVEGLIYLDISTNAIIRIESKGVLVIPALLRPVLFVAGIGVSNPTFSSSTIYQQVGNRWYPNTMRFDMDMDVERKRMFSANDNSHFTINGLLNINRLVTGTPAPVEKGKRYSAKKRPEEQVYNDYNLKWEEINVVGL